MGKLQKIAKIVRYAEGRRGLTHGVAAAVEHEEFLKNHGFGTILDAGTNKGQFSLIAVCCQPSVRIIGFEPLSGPARKYRRLFDGCTNIELRQVALGSLPGEAEVHISQRDDSSSLLPITDTQTRTFAGTCEVGLEKVRVETLDRVIDVARLPRPVLLKIDVQGFELELLKGAESSLASIDHVYSELSFLPFYAGQPLAPEVVRWLSDRGFNMAGVYHIAYSASGLAVQADFHFRR